MSGVISGLEAIREPTDHPALACRSSGLSVPGGPVSSSPFSVSLGLLPSASGDFLVVRQDLGGWGCSAWWNRFCLDFESYLVKFRIHPSFKQ